MGISRILKVGNELSIKITKQVTANFKPYWIINGIRHNIPEDSKKEGISLTQDGQAYFVKIENIQESQFGIYSLVWSSSTSDERETIHVISAGKKESVRWAEGQPKPVLSVPMSSIPEWEGNLHRWTLLKPSKKDSSIITFTVLTDWIQPSA